MDAGAMSRSDKRGHLSDAGGGFTEDAPRPPVPGEEGDLVRRDGRHRGDPGFASSKNEHLKCEGSAATPRRPDLDLGYEPEGSASPTPPHLRWAESLHSLLDDQDGIHLFRTFLKREGCADVLDFWFACSGFRQLDAAESREDKRVKLAKAIYRKYILDNDGIVSRQIKPATKSFIRGGVTRLHIDPAMFDQAQTEIQTAMEENTYPLFLKSDVYLEHARAGGESPKPCSDHGAAVPGSGKGPSGLLPTLNEDEEWRCAHGPEGRPERSPTASDRLARRPPAETAPRVPAGSTGFRDGRECRRATCRGPVDPHRVDAGYAVAPATSANDSEQHSVSSDADTVSLTDSSVDAAPPHRYRKQHRREMHQSARVNGRVPLPHMPRTNRVPKDVHVAPERFAAELIGRLEGVLREREAERDLEERLRGAQLEEEGDAVGSVDTAFCGHRLPPGACPQNYNPRCADVAHASDVAHDENPESILDDHVRRVMKTPGCQSPGTGRRSPKPRSPDALPAVRGTGLGAAAAPPYGPGKHPPVRHGVKGEAGHPCHHKHAHHVHHAGAGGLPWGAETGHGGSRSRSYADGVGSNASEHAGYGGKGGTQCKRALKRGEEARPYDMPGPADETEKNQKILLWLMEGQKETVQHKRSPYGSTAGSKRAPGHDGSRLGSAERPGPPVHPCVAAPPWHDVLPSHPFVQDPTMPPNPAPSPLIQLEEVRRRLEEEKMKSGAPQPKQRYVMEVIQRGRAAVRPALVPQLGVVPAVSDSELSEPEHKATRKQPCENITVAYYFCEELIPYRTSVKGRVVTLGQFKELLTKKGNYRYYFKKVSDEFDCGVVFEEIREDEALLPVFEEKIIGKVEKVD